MDTAPLFRPFACKSLRLSNRIAMSSLARWSTPGGDPTPLADFYRRRIDGGVGLIFTEALAIGRPGAGNDPRSPLIHGPAAEGWRAVAAAVHAAGGAIVAQLWHCGATMKVGSGSQDDRESPSGLQGPGVAHGRVMTEEDIADTVRAYGEAARLAKDLGFDGVEVHAGHGYLLDLFFWAATNLRTDRWGGATLPERSRFPLAVMRAVRDAVGPDFAVSMRVSQWKSIDRTARLVETPDELVAWLAPFREVVDLFNTSQYRYDEPAFRGLDGSLSAWTRRRLGVPTVVAGSVGLSCDLKATGEGQTAEPQPIDDVVARLDAGEFDIVSVGRGLLADPDWPRRIASGEARRAVAPAMIGPGLA